MTLMIVLSIFCGSTSAVFAEGGDSSDTAGFLKSASITSTMSNASDAYKLEPEFSPDVHDYDIIMTDSKVSAYVWATLADSASDGKITAKWNMYNNNRERTSGITSGIYLTNLQQMAGPSGKTLTLEVTKGAETQV